MNYLLIGGSPIYQTGLSQILQRCLPTAQRGLLPFGAAPEGPYDLAIVVIGNRPMAAVLEVLRSGVKPAILLGSYQPMTAVKRYFKAGAAAYLLQGTPSENLCQAVGCVQDGGTFIDPTLSAAWLGSPRGDAPQGATEALTKRERQVLELIVQEHTTDEIAGQLFVNRCTVETHRSHILQKLGVRNTAGIVREAMRRELVG